MKRLFSTTLLLVAMAHSFALGSASPGNWNLVTSPTTATGTLPNGATVLATSSASAPIVGISTKWFGSRWDGSAPLGQDVAGLVVSNVNGGDFQMFTFSSPLLDGTSLYIENFDSSSLATITANGATSISLIDSSPSISFVPAGANSGVLSTSNNGFNGEGDAALQFTGPVSSISVEFQEGEGANGVIYAFAGPEGGPVPTAEAVPEPASLAVMTGLFGLGGLVHYLRKRKAAK